MLTTNAFGAHVAGNGGATTLSGVWLDGRANLEKGRSDAPN